MKRGRDRYVRSDLLKLDMAIRKGWDPSDQLVSETFADLLDILADPLWKPRATIRAAGLILYLHEGGYPGASDAWRDFPPGLIEAAQRGLHAVAAGGHGDDRSKQRARDLLDQIKRLVDAGKLA